MGVGREAEAGILDLIGEVYDAALDETLWPGLAPRIARAFDSASAVVQSRNSGDGRVEVLAATENFDQASLESCASCYGRRDVWLERAAATCCTGVLASEDLISDQELERTEFHQDFLRTRDAFHVLGAGFSIEGDTLCLIRIHRPRETRPYDEADKAEVATFLPHLGRALEIRRRRAHLATERLAAIDLSDRSGTATLVLTGDGRVLYANAGAERLLRAGDAIRVIGGRLAAMDRGVADQLAAFIRTSADTGAGKTGGAGGAISISRADRLPITALVAPFRPAYGGPDASRPAAIIFLRDPESPCPSGRALQGLFGLTPCEAAVAAALASGRGVDDLAAGVGITLNTARTHLKNIFAKTGTSRQAQLVSVILAGVAALTQG
ncbi:MAG: helix-turn-helix transcriptional regulator [Acetobacteraceae bacterium]